MASTVNGSTTENGANIRVIVNGNKIEKGKKIGEGTYAVVYAGSMTVAESNETISVAIKKIKAGAFKDGLDLSAIREIKALKETQHRNVVKLYQVFTKKFNLNLVLEFLETDLETIIKQKSVSFGSADIKSWMLMAMRGLYHVHSLFVLHRDLKPNNLLIDAQGVLKLADFGLARQYGDPIRKMTPTVVTRWYRAPELLLGATIYGTGIDIWSMGCIFAELMLRTPYLAAETDLGQLKVILKALGTPTEQDWPGMSKLPDYHELPKYPRTPLKSLFTAATPDALDLLQIMLDYDPLKRPTSLEALQHNYFAALPRPSHPSRLPKPTKQDEDKGIKRKFNDSLESSDRKVARKLF